MAIYRVIIDRGGFLRREQAWSIDAVQCKVCYTSMPYMVSAQLRGVCCRAGSYLPIHHDMAFGEATLRFL